MFRLFNFSRNVGGNLIRSSLREDRPKAGTTSSPQFLFWFNETPGLYTPAPASPLASLTSSQPSSAVSRSKASQKDIALYVDFTEHHEENHKFEATPLFNLIRTLRYGAILAVGYNIFHDKTLARAIQESSLKLQSLEIQVPELFESHCPVLAVKHQKTAFAQPLEKHESRNDCCATTACAQLTIEDIFEDEKDVFREPSPTSDYSSHKSESSRSLTTFTKEELSFLDLQDSIPQAVDALVAIKLVKNGDKKGINQLIQLSNLGCSTSQFYLGQAYEQGICVKKNMVKAARYYTEAADGGHPEAKYNLGVFYLRGEGGCECSEAKGLKLIQEAGEQGLGEAMLVVAGNSKRDNVEDIVIEMNEVEELFHMGKVMEESELNDSDDEIFALELYRIAAQNGHKLAEEKFSSLSQKMFTESQSSSS